MCRSFEKMVNEAYLEGFEQGRLEARNKAMRANRFKLLVDKVAMIITNLKLTLQ